MEHLWHPLPPPVVVPFVYIGSQVFQAGFYLGLIASGGFMAACLFVRAAWLLLLRVSRSAPSGVCLLLLLLVSLAFASPASAQLVAGSTYTLSGSQVSGASPSASWAVLGQGNTYATSAFPQGWQVSPAFSPPSAAFTIPTGFPPHNGGLYVEFSGPQGTFDTGNFTTSAAPPPSSNCASAYPSTVSQYLADAPSPCAYFQASQGFNSSSAPLLTVVLPVLVLILAIWLGHDSIMSLFKRLAVSMTGGK